MTDADFIKTDILIIGSGLAGLKCGISALEENSKASVLIATKGAGPVGSSFTNINNALGIQVCLTDKEKELFVKKALSISQPGVINPVLANIMAEESERCFHFLKKHHIEFNRAGNGELLRYSGCFHPEIKGAFIFNNLAHIFRQLKKKYISLAGKYLKNHSVIHLLNRVGKDESAVCGGIFVSELTGKCTVIHSRITILASGGTTPLFQWNVGGLSLSGFSPAILKHAGAKIINPEFHQFTWHHPITYQPVSPVEYLKRGASIRIDEKIINKIPDKILSLIPERETHVPAAYRFPDTGIEKYLLSGADKQGIVSFVLQDKKEVPAVLCAHAWNGGAKIDQNGWTGIPGLYACGECAGGMHGANRIGGAMVLATQVFGRKAGIQAAQTYIHSPFFTAKQCIDSAEPVINRLNNPTQINDLSVLKQHVYNAGIKTLCGRENNLADIIENELPEVTSSGNIIRRLLLESALIVSSNFRKENEASI